MTCSFPAPRAPQTRACPPRVRRRPPRARGQAALEYLVLLLAGISLGVGAASPMGALWQSLLDHHARLTDAVSRP